MRRVVLIAACAACVEWTRFTGTVKAVNLKSSTVTIENREGDILTVPVDYQVKMTDKGGEMRDLKRLQINDRVILTRTPAEPETSDQQEPPTFKGDLR